MTEKCSNCNHYIDDVGVIEHKFMHQKKTYNPSGTILLKVEYSEKCFDCDCTNPKFKRVSNSFGEYNKCPKCNATVIKLLKTTDAKYPEGICRKCKSSLVPNQSHRTYNRQSKEMTKDEMLEAIKDDLKTQEV